MNNLTAEQQAFMDSFKETHDQYDVSDEKIIAFLHGDTSLFTGYCSGYTQLADARNLWGDALNFAQKAMKMKKYTVCVDYTASVHHEVEAENEEQAQKIALTKAMEAVPYDDLAVTVGYVEENEDV